MLMSTDHVEIFDNDIVDHQTSNIVIVSYLITERKLNDKKYDPYPEAFSVHGNRISGGGRKPSGKLAKCSLPSLESLSQTSSLMALSIRENSWMDSFPSSCEEHPRRCRNDLRERPHRPVLAYQHADGEI